MHRVFQLILLFVLSFCIHSLHAEKIKIIAFGDVPYVIPEGYQMFEKLIQQTEKQNADFAIHLGDIFVGPCSADKYEKMHQYFITFKTPLFYTPGDNDWTDCYIKSNGAYNTYERLSFLRSVFFKEQKYFGPQTYDVDSQANVSTTHSEYIENLSWNTQEVEFAVVHLVGSNNNIKKNPYEYKTRNAAALAWIKTSFQKAMHENRKALVLFFHANIFLNVAGHAELIEFLQQQVTEFKKPILVVHGDTHQFRFDNPLKLITNLPYDTYTPNFFRIEVFGAPTVRSVEIIIDTDKESPFTATPMPNIPWK